MLVVSFCKPVVHKLKILGGENLNIMNQWGDHEKEGNQFWNSNGGKQKEGTQFWTQIW